jgi:hypothetical protein
MEGRAVGHNFERDQPSHVWFNSVQQFQRRRFKCDLLSNSYMAMSSLTYILGFSVRFFQPVYSI